MSLRSLTEGAVLLAVYSILLLSYTYIPLVGAILIFFLPIPFMYFTSKYNWHSGMIYFVAALILSFMIGTVYNIPVTLLYGGVGTILGWGIKEGNSRFLTFSIATGTFLALIVIMFVVSVVFFDVNYLDETLSIYKESMNQLISVVDELGQDSTLYKQMMNQFISFFTTLLPSILIFISAFSVLCMELVSYPILKRLGISIKYGKPFREMSLPRSVIWYYLVIIIVSLIIPLEEGSFLYIVYKNIVYILQMLFVLQGVSLLLYFFYQKGFPKLWSMVGLVIILLNPLLSQILRLIGILDIGFDFRKGLK